MARRAPTQQVEAMLLVETNFVLATIWERSRGLIYLASFCDRYRIPIVIPEVALAEARASLLNRFDRQLDALHQLRFWLNDIARGAKMARLVRNVKQALDDLEAELRQSREKVEEAVGTFTQACTVVPLTPQIWTRAYLRWRAHQPPFKELDCLIAESLLAFLRRHRAPLTLFLTLDVEDFDHPEMRDAFRQRNALLLFEPREVIREFRKFYGVS